MVIRRAAERPEFWPYPAKPRDRATASDGAQLRRPPRPLPVPRWPWHDSPRARHTEQDHRSAPFSLCCSARSSAELAFGAKRNTLVPPGLLPSVHAFARLAGWRGLCQIADPRATGISV